MGTANAINSTFYVNPNASTYLTSPITLSQSDLTNLTTTPKLLLSAPGANLANIPIFIFTESSSGTAYTGATSVNIVDGSNNNYATTLVPLGLGGTGVINSTLVGLTVGASTYAHITNQPLYLFNKTTALTGGTQTLKIWVKYFILPIPMA